MPSNGKVCIPLQASLGMTTFTLPHLPMAAMFAVLMNKGRPNRMGRYILSDLESLRARRPRACCQPAPASISGVLNLVGGNWRVAARVAGACRREQIAQPGFPAKDWMISTVPGTVLTSYLNDEAIANPDFGDNQVRPSPILLLARIFWYRDEFSAPALSSHQHIWLNFDGINWKAEVYLNGQKVGTIDGGFMRGRFDVTALIQSRSRERSCRAHSSAMQIPEAQKTRPAKTVNGGALGREQPHLSRIRGLGLDVDHPRPQHRHLEQRHA